MISTKGSPTAIAPSTPPTLISATKLAAALAGLFAIFHGHAHGAEMPQAAEGLSYGLGFVVATAALHGAGIAIGLMRERIAARLSA